QEREHALAGLVGLGQHRGAGLGQDLALGEVHHLCGHVHVADPALGCRHVLGCDREVVDGVLEAVLHGTEVGAYSGDVLEGQVDRVHRVLGVRGGGQVDGGGSQAQAGGVNGDRGQVHDDLVGGAVV